MKRKALILYVDDDTEDRKLMMETFPNQDQFELETIESGLMLLERLSKPGAPDLPCLIILDSNMPVMNGFEVVERLKKENAFKAIPIVIFTVGTFEYYREQCEVFQVSLIEKPSTHQGLIKCWEQFLPFCIDSA